MKIEPQVRAASTSDATMLLRPKTGLKDMVVELDPGTPARAGCRGRRHDPGRADAARRQPRRDPRRRSTRDTRDYLPLLLGGGGRGPAAATAASSRNAFRRFEPTARYVAQGHRPARQAPREHQRADPQLLAGHRGARRQGRRSSPSSSTTRTPSSPRFANQDANLRATLRELPPRSTTTQTRARQGRRRWPTSSARRCRRCGPAPRARPGAAAAAAVPARDDADHPRPAPAVRARVAADGQGAAAGGARPRRRRRRTSTTHVRRPQLPAQRARLQPARQGGGLPVLARLGQPHRRRRSSRTQDAHGPIRRGLVSFADLPATLPVARAQVAHGRTRSSATLDRPARTPPKHDTAREPAAGRAGRAEAECRSRLPPSAASSSMVGLRAVVLRPAAVPVARLRRPDPAEAEGLPLPGRRSPRRRSSPGGRRAHLRRAGRQGQDDRARHDDGPHRRDDRARRASTRRSRRTRRRSCARRRCSARPTSS